jgi:hypothetical protein
LSPMSRYKAPDLPAEKITPELVRDELLKCFESANREFMELLGQPYQDEALKQQVRQFLEGVFKQCGVSIERPTKEGLLLAIETCKSNAERMMGEKGAAIIKHHYEEMMKLINKLR